MKLALGLCLAAVLAGPVRAQAADDAFALLRRIYRATEKLSYTGTFVTQQGDRVESSRITRYTGPGDEIERIEVLDGTPREIVRTRDTVRCYLPERRTVKVERRLDPRAFPALLPETFADLLRNYAVSRGESARIAGYDCESVVLTPRDDLRYGYQLWADTATGMLLRARTFNAKGETVEQFTFTQLAIGPVPRERLKPRYATRDWRIEYATVAPTKLEEQGWRLAEELPGLRQDRRSDAPHRRGRRGQSGGVFGRHGRAVGVHRAGVAPRRAHPAGARDARSGQHLHSPPRRSRGDGGRRGARGERAPPRQYRRVSPSQPMNDTVRRGER
ncbi:MAG: sigma-E factor regulatory protein RseB domain-containing protein [Burkholderiales bacterium]|nr:sigma-E factor regulatory protein RseB domain-containing protein [Burkholderiales bacterium]